MGASQSLPSAPQHNDFYEIPRNDGNPPDLLLTCKTGYIATNKGCVQVAHGQSYPTGTLISNMPPEFVHCCSPGYVASDMHGCVKQ